MEIKIIENEKLKNEWEKVASHPLQSWFFGEVRRALGIRVIRIGEWNRAGKLTNVFQLSIHPIGFGLKIGYLPRSSLPNADLLNFLLKIGEKERLIFIKIEPYVQAVEGRSFIEKLKNNFLLKDSPHPLFPKWTQIINLEKSEEELFASCHYKTRYNIRLAIKKGVKVIEQSNDQGFKIFADLYFATCKRQGYLGHNLTYHQTIWRFFKKRIAHIFVAYYQNIPLAAYQIWQYKKNIYYVYGGSSQQYRNLMGSNLLMWETIRWGKRSGAKKFDLWGSLPPNYSLDHPWAGFTRFKQGYGGEFVEMISSFDLIINPFLYKIYNIAYPFRQFLLKKITRLKYG